MDTYADSYSTYQADLAYRREQLAAGLQASRAGRTRRGVRWPVRGLGRASRTRGLTRADLVRGA